MLPPIELLFTLILSLIGKMSSFDDAVVSFGEEENTKKIFKHPVVLFFHLAFRSLCFVIYVFGTNFTANYIVSFLVILFFLSMDFWTVKNISGRLLVGLRWWNFVDDNGNSHWRFESRKDQSRTSATEANIFWAALVLTPILWFLFAFLTIFKPNWLIITILAFCMTGANLWGYLRCKWSSRQEISNFISQTMFRSLLTRATQPSTSPNAPA